MRVPDFEKVPDFEQAFSSKILLLPCDLLLVSRIGVAVWNFCLLKSEKLESCWTFSTWLRKRGLLLGFARDLLDWRAGLRWLIEIGPTILPLFCCFVFVARKSCTWSFVSHLLVSFYFVH